MIITEEIRTILCDLPLTIKGFTVLTDDTPTIVLNARLSHAQHLKTYAHEIQHILNKDFEKKTPAGLIEIYAHKENE